MQMVAEYLHIVTIVALFVMFLATLKNFNKWIRCAVKPHRLQFLTITKDGQDCLKRVGVVHADKKVTSDVEVCNIGPTTIQIRLADADSRQAFVIPDGTVALAPNTCWNLQLKHPIGIGSKEWEVRFDAVAPSGRCDSGGDADMYIEC